MQIAFHSSIPMKIGKLGADQLNVYFLPHRVRHLNNAIRQEIISPFRILRREFPFGPPIPDMISGKTARYLLNLQKEKATFEVGWLCCRCPASRRHHSGGSDRGAQLIPHSTMGDDTPRSGRVFFDFAPEPGDMDIQGSDVSQVIGLPHLTHQV